MKRSVDLEAKPSDVRDTYCDAFAPDHLKEISQAERKPGAADLITYTITVEEASGAPQTFEIREDQLPPEMLDLIDEL